jgi:hypothetical protein
MVMENCGERRVFMVLSPRALGYARLALESLYRNCAEAFVLTLVSDTPEDVSVLQSELASVASRRGAENHTAIVYSEADLLDREQDKFRNFEHLRNFRHGHPCWRKITDPLLLSEDRDEMIVLDPDLYFPNRFCFEQTPTSGVLLMWQRPSCLLPAEAVEAAFNADIALAHHTDIGVAQWRAPIDLEWLNWLIERLGSSQLPRHMHVESIVWAALAMKMGGGYLDPNKWVCWHRSQYKRILIKLGVKGTSILEKESFAGIKCFHAGGEAKWWLADACRLGILDRKEDVTGSSQPLAFEELSPSEYGRIRSHRRWLEKLGYYRILG